MSGTKAFIMLGAAMLTIGISPSVSGAQGNSGGATGGVAPTVTIIQSDELPAPGGRAVIVRRASGTPREIIVLPVSGATAADLASALSVLARARAQDNDVLASAQQRIALSRTGFAPGESAEVQRHFENVLKRLANAPRIDIPGVARGRGLILPQNRPALN